MSKPNVHFFVEETYGSPFYLLYPIDAEGLSKFVQRKFGCTHQFDDDFSGKCVQMCDETGRHVNLVALREFDVRDTFDISALAHECFHLVENILERAGVKHSRKTSEAFAYLLDSCLRRCLDKIASDTRKKKSLRKRLQQPAA